MGMVRRRTRHRTKNRLCCVSRSPAAILSAPMGLAGALLR